MANMFLDLEEIPGESLDLAYLGKIEVHDWNWNMNNDASFSLKSEQAAQQTKFSHLTVHKKFDLSTPTLMRFCAHGWKIRKGMLVCRKNDGDTKIDYLKIYLEEIKVQKLDWPAKGGDDSGAVVETVELSFHKVRVEYQLQQNSGDGLSKEAGGVNEFPLFNVPNPDKTAGP